MLGNSEFIHWNAGVVEMAAERVECKGGEQHYGPIFSVMTLPNPHTLNGGRWEIRKGEVGNGEMPVMTWGF